MTDTLIKVKDRDTVIQSLQAGVVPRRGQHLIQVGRVEETKAVIRDLDRLTEGGSAVCDWRVWLWENFLSLSGAIDRPGKKAGDGPCRFNTRSPSSCHGWAGAIALC
jgi:P-loop Domain of unknown function (DUF2791)